MIFKKKETISLLETYKQGIVNFTKHSKEWVLLSIAFLIIEILLKQTSNFLTNIFSTNIIAPIVELFLMVITLVILPAFLVAFSWEAYKAKKSIDIKKVERMVFQFDKLLNLGLWIVIKILAFVVIPFLTFLYVFKISGPALPPEAYAQSLSNALVTEKGFVFWLWLIAFIIVYVAVLVRVLFVEYEIILKNKGVVEAINSSWNKTKDHWGLLFSYQVITPFIAMIIILLTFGIGTILLIPWELLCVVYLYDKIFKSR